MREECCDFRQVILCASVPSPPQWCCTELVPILYSVIFQWGYNEIIQAICLKGGTNCSVSGNCYHFGCNHCTRTSWYSHPSQVLQASPPHFSTSFVHDFPFFSREISFSLNFVYENTIHSSISSLPWILLWFQPNAVSFLGFLNTLWTFFSSPNHIPHCLTSFTRFWDSLG